MTPADEPIVRGDSNSAGTDALAHYRRLMADALRVLKATQDQLDALRRDANEPLAIIGLGCRFPGGADGPAKYWELLASGVDAIGDVPPDRWDVERYYDPEPGTLGKMYTRSGGFLASKDAFDAAFFGISPREAEFMDPQQRLLLEVAWESLEHAGVPPDGLKGTAGGVFMGIGGLDYPMHFAEHLPRSKMDPTASTGCSHSVAAGRIAYILGLTGPAVSLDTACSSALVAVHQACESLRLKECDFALAGGVNMIVSPLAHIGLCQARFLSADGRCKTFAAAADGYGRSEGAGIVVLKRLSDATRDGDRVLAVILGSALNQDGASGGLTAPSKSAQVAVIRRALAKAAITPDDVSYVEAHGTGTSLGDPIEIAALTEVFAGDRPRDRPLWLASVKTNIGHLETAAGAAGLIKVVMQLSKGELAPHLHAEELSPHIPWTGSPFRIPNRREIWTPGVRGRVAGVSSFGFSGTNAHLIVAEAPEEASDGKPVLPGVRVLPLSARTPDALRDVVESMIERLSGASLEELDAVCRTAALGRAHFPHRTAVVGSNAEELLAHLAQWGAGDHSVGVFERTASTGGVLWCFGAHLEDAGQGSASFPGLVPAPLEDAFAWWASFDVRCVEFVRRSGVPPVALMGRGEGLLIAAVVAKTLTIEQALEFMKLDKVQEARAWLERHVVAKPEESWVSPRAEAQGTMEALREDLLSWRTAASSVDLSEVLDRYQPGLLLGLGARALEESLEALSSKVPTESLGCTDGSIARLLARLYVQGGPVDWAWAYGGRHYKRADLPTYPFRRTRYWLERGHGSGEEADGLLPHPLLGEPLEVSESGTRVHATILGSDAPTYLTEGTWDDAWVPTGLLLEVLWGAHARVARSQPASELGDILFHRALPVGRCRLQTRVVTAGDETRVSMTVASEGGGFDPVADAWCVPAATCAVEALPEVRERFEVGARTEPSRPVPGVLVISARELESERLIECALSDRWEREAEHYHAHPLLFEAAMRLAMEGLGLEVLELDGAESAVIIRRWGRRVVIHAALGCDQKACLTIWSEDGAHVASLRGLAFRGRNGLPLRWRPGRVTWVLAEALEARATTGRCVIIRDRGTVAEVLAAALLARGRDVHVMDAEDVASGPRDWSDVAFVVHLGLLGALSRETKTGEEMVDVSLRACGVLLDLLKHAGRARPHLFLVTRGVHGVLDHRGAGAPEGGALMGLGRVMAWEQPDFPTRRIDLDPEDDRGLLEEILGQSLEDEVAWRAGRRYALRVTTPLGGFRRRPDSWRLDVTGGVAARPAHKAVPAGSVRVRVEAWAVGAGLAVGRAELPHAPRVVVAIPRGELGSHVVGSASDVVDVASTGDACALAERLEAGLLPWCAISRSGVVGRDVRVLVRGGEGCWSEHAALLARASGALVGVTSSSSEVRESFRRRGFLVTSENPRDATLAEAPWDVLVSLEGAKTTVAWLAHVRFGGALVQVAQGEWMPPYAVKAVRPDLTLEVLAAQGDLGSVAEFLATPPPPSWPLPRRNVLEDALGKSSLPLRGVVTESRMPRLFPNATYLITGGLGGLGRHLCRWLVRRGARRLVLVGRTADHTAAADFIEDLTACGVHVEVRALDVSDADACAELLASLPGALRGVFHLAGVLDDGVLREQSRERFRRVMTAKIAGAWNLHRLTAQAPLDYFVCYSSSASLLGSPGQGNYAAANGFLDALCACRQGEGRPGLSINWGPWAGAGMAGRLDPQVRLRWAASGIEPVTDATGDAFLDQELSGGGGQVLALRVDWSRFGRNLPLGVKLPRLIGFMPNDARPKTTLDVEFLRAVREACGDEPLERVSTWLARTLARVLRLRAEEIHSQSSLAELGLDSLMGVELRNRLHGELGVSLPMSLLLSAAALGDVAREIVMMLRGESPRERSSEEDLIAQLEHLSEEDVARILARGDPDE